MDERKIEYLKKHLRQALSEDDYNEVNSCYQELLKHLDATDVQELAQEIAQYNKTHTKSTNSEITVDVQNLRNRAQAAQKKYTAHRKALIIGIAGGICTMILGCLLVMCGAGVLGEFDDPVMYGGLAVAIAGGIMLLIGTVFAFIKNKSYAVWVKCQEDAFKLVCAKEEKLNYLENIKVLSAIYIGQVKNNAPHGFGVGACPDGVYVGEWYNGQRSGIGKLISYDLLMTLEGEFKYNRIDGMVDIQWEDGDQWNGEYKQGLPWSGKGKTIVNNKIQQGVWKSGMFVS
jgi:hypothetical protein